MSKKRVKSSKRGLKYHVEHKSRLASLLITKLLLSFLCLGIGLLVYFFLNDILNGTIALMLSFLVAIALYLLSIIKVLKVFKFA